MVEHYTSANTDFINDLVTMISSDPNWGVGNDFGPLPRLNKKYDRKVVGLGTQKAESILIYSDLEQMKPFTLGIGINPAAKKSWYHKLSATIEIKTNLSDTRLDFLTDAVVDILKRNVTYSGYVQILLQSVKNRSDEDRGKFRTIIDVTGEKYAPTRTI